MTSKWFNAILAAAAVGPSTADAQSLDYGAFEALFAEPITASVTGSPQRESEVAATMQIITADEIRRSGARDIAGVLRHVGGVDVLQTSNDHAEVSVRGYNQPFSPRLLVLVDGRQVYADYYGFTPWSSVPVELDAIRQIEVVKGPNSALFGFNAVGGVINIVTYDPLLDDVNAATVMAGSQGLAQGSAVTTLQLGENAGLRISAGRRSGDDFSTPLQASDAGLRRGNERSALNLDGAVNIGENLLLGLEATYADAQQAEFGPIYAMTYGLYESRSLKANVAAETALGLIQATAYTNQITADVFTGAQADVFAIFDNEVRVAQVQSISKLGTRHTLRLSGEYRENAMETTPIPGAEVFYHVDAVGGMWEWQINSAVTLTTALRRDHWSLGREGIVPAGYGLTNEDWSRGQTSPSFNTGIVWQVGDADTVRFLVGRGVQMPNLFSLGGFLLPIPPVGFASGVPDLEPTIVKSYELGWDRVLAPLGAKLRLALFRGDSRDMFAIVGGVRFAQGLLSTPVNIDHSETTGLEAGVEGTFRENWRWGTSYLAQRIHDDFSLGLTAETTLVDFESTTPQHVLNANLGWSRGPWEVDGYLRYQSSVDVIQATALAMGTLVPIGSYSTVDARLGYRLNDRATLAVSGQDLTKSQQRQTAAPDVERRIFASFSMTF